jgi:hypothetical protein
MSTLSDCKLQHSSKAMKKSLPIVLMLLLALAGCKKENTKEKSPITGTTTKPAVTVTGISPATVSAGTVVTVTGTNFGTDTTGVKVLFNGVAGAVQSVTPMEIKAVVPVTTSGNVTLTIGSQTITGPAFTYTIPQVTITGISPATGTSGAIVTITGTNFSPSASGLKVEFNGVAGTVLSVNLTEIKVAVPVTTSGNITLTISGQTIQGPVFTYTIPTVTGLLPTSGTPGTLVTITGTNFVPSASGVKVLFNGVAAAVQSVSATEIKATVPVTNSGNVTVTINGQTITGPAFTYISPLVPYISGDVRLNSQADVDAFVALNKGRQLQITGSLSIGNPNSDITSLSGLANITSVSGNLILYNCPLLTDLSFLNHITSAGAISFSSLAVTTITMDNLSSVTGSLNITSCKNLNDISFKSLANTGGLNIYSCSQLSNMNFSTLSSVSGRLTVWFTNLTDLNSFSTLQTAGSISIYSNPVLSSLHGLARLTTLSLPAIAAGTSSSAATRVNGIYIAYNPKLTSLTGLQNVTTVPIIYISDNSNLNDFCPLKTPINTLSTWPAYKYTANSSNSGSSPFVTASRPALTLINNGSYATTLNALAAIALCK